MLKSDHYIYHTDFLFIFLMLDDISCCTLILGNQNKQEIKCQENSVKNMILILVYE